MGGPPTMKYETSSRCRNESTFFRGFHFRSRGSGFECRYRGLETYQSIKSYCVLIIIIIKLDCKCMPELTITKLKLNTLSCNFPPIFPIQTWHSVGWLHPELPVVAPVTPRACPLEAKEEDVHYRLRGRLEASIAVSSEGQASSAKDGWNRL